MPPVLYTCMHKKSPHTPANYEKIIALLQSMQRRLPRGLLSVNPVGTVLGVGSAVL